MPVDLAADPEGLELGQRVDDALAGDVHLVERLHGGEARAALRSAGLRLERLGHRLDPSPTDAADARA